MAAFIKLFFESSGRTFFLFFLFFLFSFDQWRVKLWTFWWSKYEKEKSNPSPSSYFFLLSSFPFFYFFNGAQEGEEGKIS